MATVLQKSERELVSIEIKVDASRNLKRDLQFELSVWNATEAAGAERLARAMCDGLTRAGYKFTLNFNYSMTEEVQP